MIFVWNALLSEEWRFIGLRTSQSNHILPFQIVNLMIIKTLKQMGFPLKDIRQIISENDAQSLEANINSHLETMRDDIMKRIDQYTECSYLLQKIQNGIDILEASSSLPSEDLAISIEHIPRSV